MLKQCRFNVDRTTLRACWDSALELSTVQLLRCGVGSLNPVSRALNSRPYDRTLRKHDYSNILIVLAPKIKNCQIKNSDIFIPRHTIVAGYYGFTLVIRVSGRLSVHPSYVRPSVRFSFPDDNLSKHQWIFTKLGMCIDIVEIWFGIANGQISLIFDGIICLRHAHIYKGFSPNLLYALTLRRSGLGLLMGKFRQIFTELSARDTPIFSFPDDNLSK